MGSFDVEVHTSHKPRRARVRARALRSTRERSKLENMRVRNLGTRLADSVARVAGSSLAMLGLALALTAASFALGSIFYLGSREEALPTPPQGTASVLTDQPGTSVRMRGYVSLDRDLDYLGSLDQRPLSLDIEIRLPKPEPLRWAVVLENDFRLPYAGPAAGTVVPTGRRHATSTLSVHGDVDRAWYIRYAGILPSGLPPTPGMPGSVVFGTTRPSRVVHLNLVGPSAQPLVRDLGYRYAVTFPVLGIPFNVEPREATAALRADQKSTFRLAAGTFNRDKISTPVRQALENTPWRVPKQYQLIDEAFDHAADDELVNPASPPESPTQWLWHGQNRLEVAAVVNRPAAEAQRQRRQFLAGILLGLGGGFVAWALQLAHELATSRTKARRSDA